MTNASNHPMQWDLTDWFPEPLGDTFHAFRAQTLAEADAHIQAFDDLPDLTPAHAPTWAAWLAGLEALESRAYHIWSYLNALTSTHADHEDYQQTLRQFVSDWTPATKLVTHLEIAFAQSTDEAFDALLAQAPLAHASFLLTRLRQSGTKRATADLEALAADLGKDGFQAWSSLYKEATGNLKFTLHVSGQEPREVPLAHKRSLTQDVDPATRRAALQGSNRAIEDQQALFTTALNSIAGTRHTLYRWRKISHFLEPSLFQARITRATLDAMHEAIRIRSELPRQFLRHKAKLLGMNKLGFQDLSAPLPMSGQSTVSWDQGRDRIQRAFHGHHADLGAFADHAFAKRWIDALPGTGRSPGGFCTSSTVAKQSRIFMTYNDTLGDLQTLAHELGHAFHNWVMRDLQPWSRRYSATLAESASIYAETVLTDALLDHPEATTQDRIAILDTRLDRFATFLLNIPMRFTFEHDFYEARKNGPLSTSQIKNLILKSQRLHYQDTLDEDQMDPWFWASKMHFYASGISFYNYPYAFGYLFSLGILARAHQEGASFFPRYVALLRDTGSHTAEEIAHKHLGEDLEQPDFWLSSIDLNQGDLDRYLQLTPDDLK